MRKIKLLSLLLALCLLFCSFVGCSKDADEETSSSTTESTTENATNFESDTNENTKITETNGITIKYPKTVTTDVYGSYEIIDAQAIQLENHIVKIEIISKRIAYSNDQKHGGFDVGFFFFFFDDNMNYLDCILSHHAGSTKIISNNIEYLEPEYKENGEIDMVRSTAEGKTCKYIYYIICPSISYIEMISKYEILNF